MPRNLTDPEIQLLKDVFKDTLRYEAVRCGTTDAVQIAVAPAGVAYFSQKYYCDDFSQADEWPQWVFVHEMVHIWQWGHHVWPAIQAICPFIQFKAWPRTQAFFGASQSKGDYGYAYYYDLAPGKKLTDYNIEQQASIVADYWALSSKTQLGPQRNNDQQATLDDYTVLVAQLQNSGPSVRKLDQVPI